MQQNTFNQEIQQHRETDRHIRTQIDREARGVSENIYTCLQMNILLQYSY